MSKSSLYNKFSRAKFQVGGNTPLGEPLNTSPNILNIDLPDWAIIAANSGVDFGANPKRSKSFYGDINTAGQTNITGSPTGSGILFEGRRGTAPLPNFAGTTPGFITNLNQGNNIIYGAPTGTHIETDANGNQSSFQPGYGPQNATQKIETKTNRNIPYNDLFTLGLGLTDVGLGFNEDIQNTRDFNEKLQRRDSKPLYDYNFMYGRTTSGGTEYQPTIKAEMGAKINTRYNTPFSPNNVEIEGGEFIQLPNFDTELAEGPSHERGGIKTSLPEGTRVYSHHLKPEGSNKTFAQLAKKYDTSKYKEIVENPFKKQVDRDTATLMMQRNQKELDKLFEIQQSMNGDSNGEMRDGGIHNPGFQALPKEVQEKILSNMEYGGYQLPEYAQGGISPYEKSKTPQGGTTPTGKSNKFSARGQGLKDYLGQWSELIPDIDKMTEGQAQDAIYSWSLKNNPEALQTMWKEFGNTNKGKGIPAINALTKNGKFSEEFLKDPKNLEMLKPAYVDNKFGVRQVDPKKPTTIPDITKSVDIGVQAGKPKQETKVEDVMPPGNQYELKYKPKVGKYTRTPFDLKQIVPDVYNLAEAQTLATYGIPEIDAPYLRPQTLNIQSQLQDIDSMTMAAMRSGADPNTAYIAALDAKQKAFQTKQNYDMSSRYETDVKNAGMRLDADTRNAAYQGSVLDTIIPTAKDAQSAQKIQSLKNMAKSYANWNSSQSDRELYYNNLIPAFNLNPNEDVTMQVADPMRKFDIPTYDKTKSTTEKKTGKKGLLMKNKVSLKKYTNNSKSTKK